MAEAIVSIILEQLASITCQQIEGEVKLIVGVDDDVRKLTSNFLAIGAVLEDAESREFQDDNVRDWLDKLEDVSYDIDDVLDEWNTSIRKLQLEEVENAMMRKVCSIIPCYRFCLRQVILRHDIALKIKYLSKTLDAIATEKNMFGFSLKESTVEIKRPMSTSIIDVLEVQGRDHDKHILMMKLLNESSEGSAISIISIVGVGGIGKTTLAQLAFNNDEVKIHFDKKIWIYVSKPFDKKRIAKAILKSLQVDVLELDELRDILRKVSQSLERKKFLLVLDNVWIEDARDWEQLRNSLEFGSEGSRILVTTHKKNVANIIGTRTTNIISLGALSEKESWSLFSKFAFYERSKEHLLEDIGRKIVGKCKGLPLAIKILGSLLRFKTHIEEWQSVLDSEIWKLDDVERGLFPPLLLSYHDLPFMLKKCFSYCAIFPTYYEIEKDKLIKLWMAQGYLREKRTKDMELIGEEYFENLAMHSFFQDFKKNHIDGSIESCKMHDIVYDFAQFLSKNEYFSIEIDDFEKSGVELSCRKVQHLAIQVGLRGSFLIPICNEKNLRSLVVKGGNINSSTLSKLFDNFTCVRRLDLIDCSIEEIPRDIKKLIHLRYLDSSENRNLKELPEILCELYNLQTLNISSCTKIEKIPRDIKKLIHLRYLDLSKNMNLKELPETLYELYNLQALNISSCTKIEKISRDIKKLIHLRYLDFSENMNLKELPETLCELYNLQTLNISNCTKLVNLPEDMGKLINLRYLINKGIKNLSYMPKGIERLTRLQNLSLLNLSSSYGGKAFSIECLKNLNDLRAIDIWGLKNVVDVAEVKRANLKNKGNLFSLGLYFDRYKTWKKRMNENDEIVLEALEPPSNLVKLEVGSYEGTIWPHWMLLLTQLRELHLRLCYKCEYLPPLGRLSSLQSLYISGTSIKKVGNEFLGIESVTAASSFIAFPKLKYLTFSSVYYWKEWHIIEGGKNITIMPSLISLKIEYGPLLRKLPDHIFEIPTLKRLEIVACPILQNPYQKYMEEEYWYKISDIPNIIIRPWIDLSDDS